MQVTQRERTIMVVAAVVVGLFLLDRLVIGPIWRWRSDVSQRRQQISGQIQTAQLLLESRDRFQARWDAMLDGGLSRNRSEAERAVYHALRSWAQASGLQLEGIHTEHPIEDGPLSQITFRTRAIGRMQSVTRFLEQIQGAELPVKVTRMRLSSRRPGIDDLALDLHLSTLYRAGHEAGGDDPSSPAAAGGEI